MSNMLNLTERLASPATGLDPEIWVPLLRLLAQGHPVELGALAAAAGKTMPEVIRALANVPDTEYDDAGRIIGQGLTLNPTLHHIEIDGTPLYTWCALDTLIFPAILGVPARIESACHATSIPVLIHIDATGAVKARPTTTVISLVNPDDMASVRSAFCNQVHFFASAEAAQPWLSSHPAGSVVSLDEACRLGALTAQALKDGTLPKRPVRPAGAQGCC